MALPMASLGWMAGIIDIKGRLIRKNNQKRKTPQSVLTVDSKDTAIIRRLGSLTGTRPEFKNTKAMSDFIRRGCNEHCPEAHVHVHDKEWIVEISRWTITGAGLVVVLGNLLPYLAIDRGYDQAIEEIEEDTVLAGRGSHAVYLTLARLRDLHWDLPPRYEEALKYREKIIGQDAIGEDGDGDDE